MSVLDEHAVAKTVVVRTMAGDSVQFLEGIAVVVGGFGSQKPIAAVGVCFCSEGSDVVVVSPEASREGTQVGLEGSVEFAVGG